MRFLIPFLPFIIVILYNFLSFCFPNMKGWLMMSIALPLIPIIITLVVIIFVLSIIRMSYVKAPPNVAFIISGLQKVPRILIGRAGLKFPFIERLDELYLGQMSVDINTEQAVPTNDFINVNVDAVAKVRLKSDDAGIQIAAKNFLNLNPQEITIQLVDSLQGNLREIIGTMSLRDINTNRDKFSDEVMAKAVVDMNKLGVEIISCNIQNITDDNGIITDLGMDNISKIKKDASIAKAQADRDVAIAQAMAAKEANDAKITADTLIAERNNDLIVRKAELQKIADTKKAEADAAYEIQLQEQQKTIQITTVNAQIAKTEREAELKEREVTIKEQTLNAEIKKQAEAEKYRVEQEALAELEKRKRDAEAKAYEELKQAEVQKAKAEAEKYSMEQEALGIKAKALAEAEGLTLKGTAEATAIQAKGNAEAEAMMKRAEAYKQYNNAAMVEMLINALPSIAGEIAKPLSAIDKISIIGNAADATTVSNNIPIVMAQLFKTVQETTGLNLIDIVKANSLEAQTTKNINISGLSD